MKFQFKIQPFQTEAAESVVKVFAEQPNHGMSKYRLDLGKRKGPSERKYEQSSLFGETEEAEAQEAYG
jgi:type III restriction enzyme